VLFCPSRWRCARDVRGKKKKGKKKSLIKKKKDCRAVFAQGSIAGKPSLFFFQQPKKERKRRKRRKENGRTAPARPPLWSTCPFPIAIIRAVNHEEEGGEEKKRRRKKKKRRGLGKNLGMFNLI